MKELRDMTYEEATISLGYVYMNEIKADREGFIAMMKKLKQVRGSADLYYCFVAVETSTIPNIKTLSDSEKNKYWSMIKDEPISKGEKIMFCRGLYALDTMIPLLNL